MPLKKFEVIQPKYESYGGNPLPRFFYVLERLLKDVDIPGARILMLLGLVLVAWFVLGARTLGSFVFIRLVFVLARRRK